MCLPTWAGPSRSSSLLFGLLLRSNLRVVHYVGPGVRLEAELNGERPHSHSHIKLKMSFAGLRLSGCHSLNLNSHQVSYAPADQQASRPAS